MQRRAPTGWNCGFAALALAGALALVVVHDAAAQGNAARAYRAPRTADGKPDLNGIWQAVNAASWDLEDHAAKPPALPTLGAMGATPAGMGVVVGGEETMIELTKRRFKTGITFELPRASLVAAMKWEIFDDVLLGNYMKTTLHGIKGLHPGFTPYVAKYADNGRAKTAAEIETYWQHYRARNPIGMIRHELALKTTHRLRSYVLSDGQMIKWAYNAYRRLHAIPTPARDGQHRPAAS